MDPSTVFSEDDWRSGRGRFASWRGEGEWSFDPEPLRRALERVAAMRPLAERLGMTVPQLALRWVLEQRGVTAVIAGSRNPAHTRVNAGAGETQLDAATLDELT